MPKFNKLSKLIYNLHQFELQMINAVDKQMDEVELSFFEDVKTHDKEIFVEGKEIDIKS